jgi:hypothetical protein
LERAVAAFGAGAERFAVGFCFGEAFAVRGEGVSGLSGIGAIIRTPGWPGTSNTAAELGSPLSCAIT